MSGRRFAKAAGWQPSKVSKILNGKQAVTDVDLLTWCQVTGASDDETEQLRATLRSIRTDEARWVRQLAAGHRALQDEMASSEQAATHIRSFDLALIPGLLQTAEYARNVFLSLATLRGTVRDVDEAVRARMQRQNVLYDSGKTIELLTSEFSLRCPVGSRSTMAAQIDRLLALEGLPAIRFGIIPLNVEYPLPPLHGFTILSGHVLVETLHREASTEDPDDVVLYERIAEQLWSVAVEGDEARAVLRQVAAELRASG